MFTSLANIRHVKLIRDKQKGTPVGYGFVEFQDYRTAKEVFQALNGKLIPGSRNKYFKLNWASHGGGAARAVNQYGMNFNNQVPEGYQVYVGDLDPSVNNVLLMQTFKQIYPSVFEAKVICDSVSRQSKGYGFIKFGLKEESERALQEMSGKIINGRPIKMNYASQRNKQVQQLGAGGPPNQMDNQRFPMQNPMPMMPIQPGHMQGGPMGGQMP